MKRRWLWIGLAASAALVALGWFTGVLPGIARQLSGPPSGYPAVTNVGIPADMEIAEGYLAVYKRLLPHGGLLQQTKIIGVDFSRMSNLNDEARAWLLEQIGRYTGAEPLAGSYDDFRAKKYVERDGNLTEYGDGFMYVSFQDKPYENGFLEVEANAAAGPLSGLGIRCRLQHTVLGWKIETIGTSIS